MVIQKSDPCYPVFFSVKLPFCLAVFFFKQCETYLSSSLRVVGFNCSKSEVVVSAQTDQKSKSKPSFVLFSLNTEVVLMVHPCIVLTPKTSRAVKRPFNLWAAEGSHPAVRVHCVPKCATRNFLTSPPC